LVAIPGDRRLLPAAQWQRSATATAVSGFPGKKRKGRPGHATKISEVTPKLIFRKEEEQIGSIIFCTNFQHLYYVTYIKNNRAVFSVKKKKDSELKCDKLRL
jgi:hypothetical protein